MTFTFYRKFYFLEHPGYFGIIDCEISFRTISLLNIRDFFNFSSLVLFCKPSLGLNSEDIDINGVLKLRFVVPIFFIGILNGSVSSGTGLLVTILLIKTFKMDFLRAVSSTFFTGHFLECNRAISLSRIALYL